MITTRFFSLLLLLLTNTLHAQNLVPNPSFEEFENGCPENLNEMPVSWTRWKESANSFSTCVNPQSFSDSLGGAPWNGWGYQWPADGESYTGLAAFSPSPSPVTENDFREYLGCELIEPLEVDETYYVSFKTNMGFTGSYYNVTYACNRLGAFFTTQAYHYQDNLMEIPNEAHVYEENIITDTLDWVTISGSFVADQPFTYMGLGVFFDFDSLSVLQLVPGLSLGSYYFIDDVCVSRLPECDGTTMTEEKETHINIFPNPADDIVFIESNVTNFKVGLYNLKGQEVIPHQQSTGFKFELNLNNLSEGIYLLEYQSATVRKRKKLVVVH